MRLFVLVLVISLFSAGTAWAYVANSDNYFLDSDSLNSAGGKSSSATRHMADSVGETATGSGSSASFQLQAGYQAMVPSPLSLSSPSDITLSPTISAGSGGQANGRARWRIVSNGGFSFYLGIAGGGKAALRSSTKTFSNYSGISLNWTPAPSVPTFGFNPFGTYTHDNYYSDILHIVPTGNCGASILPDRGTQDGYCWDGLGESAKLIGQAASGPTNDDLYINFRADYQVPVTGGLDAGIYQANLVVTLLGA